MASFGVRLMNAVARFVLRTPLRGGPARRVMLVNFTGKKTGKVYNTPVSYTQSGDVVTFFTDGSWWKNLSPQAQITVRIRGKNYSGLATPCTDDHQAIAAGITHHLTQLRFENNFYGVKMVDGKPSPEDVERMAKKVVMVKVRIRS